MAWKQIAYSSNQRNLIAFYDNLQLAKAEDKSPFGIHGKYSRIVIAVNDFSSDTSQIAQFQVTPEYCAYLLTLVKNTILVPKTEIYEWLAKVYNFDSQIDKKTNRCPCYRFTIARQKYMKNSDGSQIIDEETKKPKVYDLPWTITIKSGTCVPDKDKTKSKGYDIKYDVSASKRLNDLNLYEMLTRVNHYIQLWEMIHFKNYYSEMLMAIPSSSAGSDPGPDVGQGSDDTVDDIADDAQEY